MREYDNTLPGRIERTCEQCGETFFTFRSNVKRGHGCFCSFECGVAHREIPLETRFWNNVQKGDGCWNWTGYMSDRGYGKFNIKRSGKWAQSLAHRVSYEMQYGAIPEGLQACHQCDNPACVRPDHLFLGTNDDNVQDKMDKGRQMKGVHVHASKMTEDRVIEIRQRYAQGGITKTALAKEYGLGKPAMGDILNGVTWKHLL